MASTDRLTRDNRLGEYEALSDSFRLSLEARNRSPRTVQGYLEAVSQLGAFLADQGMPLQLANMHREHVEAFVVELLAKRSPATAVNRFKSLQVFFKWALEEGEIQTSPMERMHPPTVPDNPPEVLQPDALRQLLKTCDGRDLLDRRDTAIIMLLLDSGLRRAELAGVLLEDLDLRSRSVEVTGKGGRRRVVPFGARTAQAIDRYLRTRPPHPFAYRPELWLSQRGALSGDGVRQLLERRAAEAGIDKIHAHQFRHTFAHQWRLSGGDDDGLMVIAGWKSREMLNRYGRSAAAERARETHKRHSFGDRL